MKTAASGASSSGGGGTSTNVSKNDPNGKQRAMIGSSGSETSSNPAYSQDLSASQQSFKMAMGNPCEFFVDVMWKWQNTSFAVRTCVVMKYRGEGVLYASFF